MADEINRSRDRGTDDICVYICTDKMYKEMLHYFGKSNLGESETNIRKGHESLLYTVSKGELVNDGLRLW